MNPKNLAKILVSATVIYWFVMISISVFQFVFYLFTLRQDSNLLWAILPGVAIYSVIAAVLVAVFTRRDKIAEKIAGTPQISSPQVQPDWIPFSFRLVSVIGGLYFFGRAIWQTTRVVFNLTNMLRCRADGQRICSGGFGSSQLLENCIVLVLLLVVGTYLLCGAPHFVRWQTRKTIEMFQNDQKK